MEDKKPEELKQPVAPVVVEETVVDDPNLDVLDFGDVEAADSVRYATVENGYGEGKHARIASLNSRDMIAYLEHNMDQSPQAKEVGNIRLLVMSIVNKAGERIPEEQRAKYEMIFLGRDAVANGEIIHKALVLNGLRSRIKRLVQAKNDSGEAPTGSSPTA